MRPGNKYNCVGGDVCRHFMLRTKKISPYAIISTILILLTIPNLKSQDYYSFLSEKPQWNVYLENAMCTSVDTSLLRYYFEGDTIINGTTYQKLILETGDTAGPKKTTAGGIREVGKKVYYIGDDFLGHPKDEEVLLYDFSKEVGDTIFHETTRGYLNFYSEVIAIDSLKIGDNYRKRFKVANHWYYHDPDYWVEGMGSIKNGLLGHITKISTCGYHYWEHVCYKENEEVMYLNQSYSDCYPINVRTSVNTDLRLEKIKIYPNPVSNKLHIDNIPENEDWRIKIVNSLGQSVLENKLNSNNNHIDLSSENGLLIIMLIDSNGQLMKSEKIIN